MTWTYSGDPASSNLDALRFKIGDTDDTNPELQDEELNYVIANNTISSTFFLLKAGLQAIRSIYAKYKALVDEKVGDVDVKWSQRFKNVKKVLFDLEQEHAKSSLSGAYAGGISIADKTNREDDPDRVIPAFTKNFGENKRKSLSGTPRERTSQIDP